jgi:hypothetical protein
MKGAARALVCASLLMSAASAGAQATSPTADCAEHARSIARALDADSRHSRVWYWSWMGAGAALIAGQATLATLVEGDQRTEFVAGAATSVLIPVVLIVHPPLVLADAPVLEARLQATTVDGSLGDACIAVARARELLDRDARDQAFTTGWLAHVFAIGVNVGVGLLLGLGFHDWWGAARQAVGGSAVGELQILTMPTGAIAAQRQTGPTSPGGLGFAGTF